MRFLLFLLLLVAPLQAENNIKAIIFDFGGVITTTDEQTVHAFLGKTFDLTPSELSLGLVGARKACNFDPCQRAFWEKYALSLGKKVPPDWFSEYEAVLTQAIKPIPGMKEILSELKQKGYTVGLLSNVVADKARLLKKLGYYAPFDPLLLSSDIKVEKPDPQAYRILLQVLQLPSEKVLFIDNAPVNIHAARKAGLKAFCFTNPAALKKYLIRQKIL